jgi:hypothetical protein
MLTDAVLMMKTRYGRKYFIAKITDTTWRNGYE